MAHKCFISFKTEDAGYKDALLALEGLDLIDKSLHEAINSIDEDYIMQKIRSDYLADSTVTIHLIGLHGAENKGGYEQRFIKRELQASLYDGQNNTKSGILGIVLPHAYGSVYKGQLNCLMCGGVHNHVAIDDGTVVKEFSYNYYIPHGKCAHTEDDRYCVLVNWDDFVKSPKSYIEAAYNKRSHPISGKTKVKP